MIAGLVRDMIMMTKAVEEVFEGILDGNVSLDEFKAWLALWSVAVLKEFSDETLS
jgi:hypothetical protein